MEFFIKNIFNLAIQCNRTGRLSSVQEASASSTSSYASYESDIPQQQQQQLSTSSSMEKEFYCLLPQTLGSGNVHRKRSSTSPDSESASKRAYTISALLDFPKSDNLSTTDENSR